jgi:hemolysin activation/secretion protein
MVHHFARLKRFRFKHQTGALLAGFYLSTTVVAQITPEQERDIGVRNQQELQRQQQQEQQLRQQQERTPDVRLNTPHPTVKKCQAQRVVFKATLAHFLGSPTQKAAGKTS